MWPWTWKYIKWTSKQQFGGWELDGAKWRICAKRPRAPHMQIEVIILWFETTLEGMVWPHFHILCEQRFYDEPCGSLVACFANLPLYYDDNHICRQPHRFRKRYGHDQQAEVYLWTQIQVEWLRQLHLIFGINLRWIGQPIPLSCINKATLRAFWSNSA